MEAGLVERFLKWYQYVNYEASDPRVRDWFFMTSFLYPVATIALYLLVILKLAPAYMKNRKPYKLNTLIVCYNIIQVILCSCIFLKYWNNGWSDGTYSFFRCYGIEYSYEPREYTFIVVSWCCLLTKVLDLFDTLFFILRKKDNQVTLLHLYHHSTTVLMAWLGCKYISGIMLSVPGMINSGIHVIMYSYYLLALLKFKWIQSIKKYITIIQMTQFIFFILYSLNVVFGNCKFPVATNIVYIYQPYVIILFYLFYDYFKNAHNKQDKKKNHNS